MKKEFIARVTLTRPGRHFLCWMAFPGPRLEKGISDGVLDNFIIKNMKEQMSIESKKEFNYP